jgi:hypothetical protein
MSYQDYSIEGNLKSWKDYQPAKSYKTTKSVKYYLEHLLEKYNNDTKQFVYHLLSRSQGYFYDEYQSPLSLINNEFSGYIPISYEWRTGNFRCSNVQQLELDEVIEIDHSYSIKNHKCKRYRINPIIIKHIGKLIIIDLEADELERYDLIRGVKLKKEALKNILSDESGNKYPELVITRIKNYSHVCYFNKVNAVKLLKLQQNKYDQLCKKYGNNSTQAESYWQSHFSDVNALKRIVVDFGAVSVPATGLWCYKTAYKAQVSGRISHILGGFQNASSELSAAAMQGVPNLYNYDIKSAQVVCLSIFIKSLSIGIDTSFLDEYFINSSKKKELFARIGADDFTCKGMVISNCMLTEQIDPDKETTIKRFEGLAKKALEWEKAKATGNYTKQVTNFDGETKTVPVHKPEMPAMFRYTLQYTNYDAKKAYELLKSFNSECQPLLIMMRKVEVYLRRLLRPKKSEELATHGTKCSEELITERPKWLVNIKGKLAIKNAMGMLLYIDEIPTKSLASKVMAHLLQGMEGNYMTHIGVLSKKYNYQLVQDMHDGAWVFGKIPDEAQQEAAALSGLNLTIVIKEYDDPFINEGHIKEAMERFDALVQEWGLNNNPAFELLPEHQIVVIGEGQSFEVVNKQELVDFLKDETTELEFINNEQQAQWVVWFKTIDDEHLQKLHLERFKRYVKRQSFNNI